MRTTLSLFAATTCLAGLSTPALAAPGDPIEIADGVTFDLQAATRLRYETVSQANQANDAEALTFRARIGGEVAVDHFKFLIEGEGTVALVDDYFDTIPQNGAEPYPTIADPESYELNRLQASYMVDGNGATLGRQRIIMGNARFVGNVGWRQNEQTFDAVRAQLKQGPVTVDAAFAIDQRTIFGSKSPNSHFDGNFTMVNVGGDFGPIKATAFAYILDYNSAARFAFSSQTYGASLDATVPLAGASLKLSGTIATQSDAAQNPTMYRTEYYAASAALGVAGFTLTGGYEELGSDNGVASFQTPLATLHAFQGWADVFLTTPVNGVEDFYGGISKAVTLPGVGAVTAAVTYHEFDAAFGSASYGSEWDASLGFKIGPVALLAKYANYDADTFGTDTKKFWLQAEYGF